MKTNKILLLMVFSLMLIASVRAFDNSSFSTRQPIFINVTFNNLNQTSTLVNILYDEDMQTNFGDLRFTDSNNNELGYWFYNNSYIDGVSVDVWIKTEDLNSSENKTIYMYFGNSTLSTTSNIDNSFMFADDFNGTSVDWTNRWDSTDHGLYNIENGFLNVSITGGSYTDTICSKYKFNSGYDIESRDTIGTIGSGGYYRMPISSIQSYNDNDRIGFNGGWDLRMSGSGITLGSPQADTWYRYFMNINETGKSVFNVTSDSLVEEASREDFTSLQEGYMCYIADASGVVTDWMYVRRDVPEEPTYTFGTEISLLPENETLTVPQVCGVINVSGVYTLTQNVSVGEREPFTASCFDINTDDVTLDGNGYNIDFIGGTGIYIAEPRNNITIKNFIGIGGSEFILSNGLTNSFVQSNILGTTNNLYFNTGEELNNIFLNNYANCSSDCISIELNSTNDRFIENQFISLSNTYISDGGLNNTFVYNLSGYGIIIPQVLKDGVPCSSSECNITDYNDSILTFVVTNLGTFTIREFEEEVVVVAQSNNLIYDLFAQSGAGIGVFLQFLGKGIIPFLLMMVAVFVVLGVFVAIRKIMSSPFIDSLNPKNRK